MATRAGGGQGEGQGLGSSLAEMRPSAGCALQLRGLCAGRLRTRRGGVAPRDRGPRAQSVSGARPAHTAPRTVTVFWTDGNIFGASLRQSGGEALLSAAEMRCYLLLTV